MSRKYPGKTGKKPEHHNIIDFLGGYPTGYQLDTKYPLFLLTVSTLFGLMGL